MPTRNMEYLENIYKKEAGLSTAVLKGSNSRPIILSQADKPLLKLVKGELTWRCSRLGNF